MHANISTLESLQTTHGHTVSSLSALSVFNAVGDKIMETSSTYHRGYVQEVDNPAAGDGAIGYAHCVYNPLRGETGELRANPIIYRDRAHCYDIMKKLMQRLDDDVRKLYGLGRSAE